MNILLIFFAIPVATIILSGILETFIHCPYKVAGIFFSIFLVIAFALGGTAELLVAALVYTIISFVTAYIVMLIRNKQRNCYNYNNFRYNPNSFNNFEPISFGSNNDISNTNSLSDSDTSSNFNNLNGGCRYR